VVAEDLLGKDPPRSSAAHSDSAYCDMLLPLREPTWLNSLLDSPCCFVLGHLALSACLWYPLLALTCLYRLRKCTILLIYKLLCCCLCLCCTNRQGRDPGSTPGSQLSYRPRAHADAGAPNFLAYLWLWGAKACPFFAIPYWGKQQLVTLIIMRYRSHCLYCHSSLSG
jgi:hypothetical protein